MTVMAVDVGSAFRVITGVTLTFFSCEVATFLGGGFEVVDCFVVVVFAGVVDCVICLTHSRNVISSNAKSFPQPLGLLSLMINLSVDTEAGVVK